MQQLSQKTRFCVDCALAVHKVHVFLGNDGRAYGRCCTQSKARRLIRIRLAARIKIRIRQNRFSCCQLKIAKMYRCGAPLALRLIASDAQSSSSMGFISTMTSLLQFRETLLAKAESSCSAKRSLAAVPTPPSAHAPPYSLWRADNKNLYRSSVSQRRNTRYTVAQANL